MEPKWHIDLISGLGTRKLNLRPISHHKQKHLKKKRKKKKKLSVIQYSSIENCKTHQTFPFSFNSFKTTNTKKSTITTLPPPFYPFLHFAKHYVQRVSVHLQYPTLSWIYFEKTFVGTFFFNNVFQFNFNSCNGFNKFFFKLHIKS